MFVVSPYAPEVRLLWRDGAVRHFSSVAAAARYAREYRLLGNYGRDLAIGDAFGITERRFDRELGFHWYSRAPHVVCRTEHGDVVPVESLLESAGFRRWYVFSWWRAQRPEDYRRAPVPGVHKHRGRNYFRYPQTARELRQQVAYAEELREHGLTPQQVGRVRDVVTAWDDIPRDVDNRGWKKHRPYQARGRFPAP